MTAPIPDLYLITRFRIDEDRIPLQLCRLRVLVDIRPGVKNIECQNAFRTKMSVNTAEGGESIMVGEQVLKCSVGQDREAKLEAQRLKSPPVTL